MLIVVNLLIKIFLMKKKLFLASLIILAMSVSFVACQSSEKTEEEVSGRPGMIKETIKNYQNQNQGGGTEESDDEMEAELSEEGSLDEDDLENTEDENQERVQSMKTMTAESGAQSCAIVCTDGTQTSLPGSCETNESTNPGSIEAKCP